MKKKAIYGFTLLEMSIVLAIIGTIVGAIMFGKTLLTTSKLQTVITDADTYLTATTNFKQTYQSLPGDMPGATNIWGAVSSGCTSQQGTGTQTCNGNGDGEIGPTGQEYEADRFWQHLYNAGMIIQSVSGSYSGSNYMVPGVNVPAGAFKGSGYFMQWIGTVTNGSSSTYYNGSWGNVLLFGTTSGYNLNLTASSSLTAEQAYSIDSKVDDGIPSSGSIRGSRVSNCTNDTVSGVTGYYTITSTNVGTPCTLIFVTGF